MQMGEFNETLAHMTWRVGREATIDRARRSEVRWENDDTVIEQILAKALENSYDNITQ